MQYRKEIDGLRAIAVIPVLFFHAGFEWFAGGFVGVDVFFVISGYLITGILLKEMQEGTFSILNFYERRARRILPALFLVMAVCVVLAWQLLYPADMQSFAQSVLAVCLFVSNFLFWYQSGYFDTASDLKPLLHTWSLAVEEQYYVLFPLVLLLVWKVRKQWLVPILALIALASLCLGQWQSLHQPSSGFFLLPARAWELLVGALAAVYVSRHSGGQRKAWHEAMAIIGLCAIAWACLMYSKVTPFPGVYALVPTLGAALIIVFADGERGVGRWIASKYMVAIGLISYSTYLWHQPIFAFARHIAGGDPGHLVFCVLIALSLLLAWLTWKWIEAPFRDRKKFSRQQIFALALLMSAVFIGFGYAGHKQKGFDSRFERVLHGDVGHQEFLEYIDQHFHDCEPPKVLQSALSWGGFVRCKQSALGTPEVVLLGDSHAEHLFIGLAESLPKRNVAFYIQAAKPYLEVKDFAAAFEELLGNSKPQTVLLSMYYMERLKHESSSLQAAWTQTITALQQAGKQVVVLGDVPKFPQDPEICMYSKVRGDWMSACDISVEELQHQYSFYDSTLRALSTTLHVPYVQVDAPLCGSYFCRLSQGEQMLYRDKNHLNIAGSRVVGAYVAQQLKDLAIVPSQAEDGHD